MKQEKKNKFPVKDWLLSFIRERGNKVKACREVGVGLTALEAEIDRNKTLRDFVTENWDESIELLKWKTMDLATNGYMKAVWFRGMQCGSERAYIPQLQMFMLSKLLPEQFGDDVDAESAFSPDDYVRMLKLAMNEGANRMGSATAGSNGNGNGTNGSGSH